mgnify:CR=1 FL=1
MAFQDKTSTTFLIMDVVLKNGSTEPRQASLLHVRAMTGTREAMQVMDRDSGVTTSNEMIAPGAEYRGKIAFGVDAGQPFVLTAHFEFDRGGVIYKDEGCPKPRRRRPLTGVSAGQGPFYGGGRYWV